MAWKKREALLGLVCPQCGRRTVGVRSTMGYDNCVVRQRECATCGFKVQTVEIPMDLDVVMRSAVQIIMDNAKESLRLPGREIRKPIPGVDG